MPIDARFRGQSGHWEYRSVMSAFGPKRSDKYITDYYQSINLSGPDTYDEV